MKQHEKVQSVAMEILKAFEEGTVPPALAQDFLRQGADYPARRWSLRNRVLAILRGHCDARGYRQWQEVGRQVKKGERAFHILGPRTVKAREADEEKGIEEGESILVGFVALPVFGYGQTEGEPLPGAEDEVELLDALPLVEVARSWGLSVTTFPGGDTPYLGYYRPGEGIALGVSNLATWAHELVHSADHRLGSLNGSRKVDREVVAELGGAVLLECLGYRAESDRGGAYRYIEAQAKGSGESPLAIAEALLERTCACVELLLAAAREIGGERGSPPLCVDGRSPDWLRLCPLRVRVSRRGKSSQFLATA